MPGQTTAAAMPAMKLGVLIEDILYFKPKPLLSNRLPGGNIRRLR